MLENHCPNCNKRIEKAVFDLALRTVCPACSTALKIIESGARTSFTIEQSLVLLLVGFVGYKVLKEISG